MVSTTTPISLTLDNNKVITATFTQILTYTLTTNTDGDGTGAVSLDPDGGIYAHGTVVTLTATSSVSRFVGEL